MKDFNRLARRIKIANGDEPSAWKPKEAGDEAAPLGGLYRSKGMPFFQDGGFPSLPKFCPVCGNCLDQGQLLVIYQDGLFQSVTQTVRIGRHDYAWIHRLSGCTKPASLLRLPPLPPCL